MLSAQPGCQGNRRFPECQRLPTTSNCTSSAICTAQTSVKISRIASCVRVKPLIVASGSIVARVSSPKGENQESALENEIVSIGRERNPFKHVVPHNELNRDMLPCRFVLDECLQLHRIFRDYSKTSMYRSTLGFTRSWSAYRISLWMFLSLDAA